MTVKKPDRRTMKTKNAIFTALAEALGHQITLRYPRNGEHRSAVVRADVDNDGQEEAIVFYRQATESTGARMVLLDTDSEGEWTLTGEFADAEGEIDRIVFGDINADGALDIITGWMEYSDYGTLYVHSCSDGSPRLLNIIRGTAGAYALSSYAELAVGDFDRDGTEEVLTISMASGDDAGEARLLKWKSNGRTSGGGWIQEAGSLSLGQGAAKYTGSVAGMLNRNDYGIVVDSQRTDGSYFSELVMWDRESGRLVSPPAEENLLFRRTRNTESCDIDGDGYIEIPGDSLMPDCDSIAAQKIYLTDWYRFSQGRYAADFSAVMRQDSGYYFTVPDRWREKVTVQPDAETRTLRFYRADNINPFSSELMSLRVFTMDEWDEERSSGRNEADAGYIELHTTDYYVYAVRIVSSPQGLGVNYETVQKCFNLMV